MNPSNDKYININTQRNWKREIKYIRKPEEMPIPWMPRKTDNRSVNNESSLRHTQMVIHHGTRSDTRSTRIKKNRESNYCVSVVVPCFYLLFSLRIAYWLHQLCFAERVPHIRLAITTWVNISLKTDKKFRGSYLMRSLKCRNKAKANAITSSS